MLGEAQRRTANLPKSFLLWSTACCHSNGLSTKGERFSCFAPPTTHHSSSIIHHLQSQPPKSIMDQLEAERKPLLCIIPSVVRTPILWLIFDILAELNHFSSRIEKPAPLQTRLGFENNPQAYRTFRVHYLSFKLTVGLVASSYDRWGCQLWT